MISTGYTPKNWIIQLLNLPSLYYLVTTDIASFSNTEEMPIDYNYSFLIYTSLIMTAEIWMLWYVYQETKKAYFLAISPLRWLSIIILVLSYESFGKGFLLLLFLIVSIYWLFINVFVNLIVLKKPILYVGADGMIGRFLNNLFGNQTRIYTFLIKLLVLASAIFLFVHHQSWCYPKFTWWRC